MDNKLNVSQHCTVAAVKANRLLGCILRGITSRNRDMITPLFSGLVRLYLEYCVPFWSPQFKTDRLERVQRKTRKMMKEPENLPYEERLKELGLFSMEKRRLSRDLITVFQHLKGSYKEAQGSLFTRDARRNWQKSHQERFLLNVGKRFFTGRRINHWNNFQADVVEDCWRSSRCSWRGC